MNEKEKHQNISQPITAWSYDMDMPKHVLKGTVNLQDQACQHCSWRKRCMDDQKSSFVDFNSTEELALVGAQFV